MENIYRVVYYHGSTTEYDRVTATSLLPAWIEAVTRAIKNGSLRVRLESPEHVTISCYSPDYGNAIWEARQ